MEDLRDIGMKMFCDWVKEIKSLVASQITVDIVNTIYDAISVEVKFLGRDKKLYAYGEVIEVGNKDAIESNFSIALDKIKLFMKSRL